ncbi:DUF262 domain-containing HNH endonuclease family protein [Sphingobium aquiterrae]|uniref:DUF262 domain-containing protein n=1 Tax=Sphingobium aquiterrae TaxID=2038656 RepID=UPI003018929A
MASTLSAHEKKVGQIFSDEFQFNIPGYQRPYAWTPEQAGELLDDLLSFMREQSCSVSEMSPYFLGSIVLIKAEGSPSADVVDGQQRLTTLTLLLATLREVLPADRAQEITQFLYQAGSLISGTEDRFRLALRERDREFFQTWVQRPDGISRLIASTDILPDSRNLLRRNARHYIERLSKLDQLEVTRLAQFIAMRCFLVVVSTPDLDAAYRIFSVMNSRGLDLSATDILKAEIIGNVPADQRDLYTKRWEDQEEQLGRDAFVELFGHIRMIYRKAKPQGTLLREFETHVSKDRDARSLISDIILPYALAFEEVRESSYSSTAGAELVNHHLKWLNRLEFSDWVPPALAFAVKKRSSATDLAAFFADLERLSYFMLLCRWGVNDRLERFSRLTREIEDGLDLHADESALQLTIKERARAIDALDGPVYESLSARARSSILLRLDDLLSGGGATYDYPSVTVEHVLPQTPVAGSLWLDWFPDDDVRKGWTHRLGNLALLTRKKNSSASNYELARKKEAYFTNGGVSPFPLTTQILGHDVWNSEILEKRHKLLLDLFVKHWRL